MKNPENLQFRSLSIPVLSSETFIQNPCCCTTFQKTSGMPGKLKLKHLHFPVPVLFFPKGKRMNDNKYQDIDFGQVLIGLIKLAICLPLLWWLIPRLPMVRDFYIFFTETLPSLFRLFFFGPL